MFRFPFPGILGNDSLWFPFPNCGNGFFSFPSRSRILGIDFFIPFPFPNFGNVFFCSLPVPELREWVFSIPFPFPNFWNGIIHSRSRSRTPKCHSRSPLAPYYALPYYAVHTMYQPNTMHCILCSTVPQPQRLIIVRALYRARQKAERALERNKNISFRLFWQRR